VAENPLRRALVLKRAPHGFAPPRAAPPEPLGSADPSAPSFARVNPLHGAPVDSAAAASAEDPSDAAPPAAPPARAFSPRRAPESGGAWNAFSPTARSAAATFTAAAPLPAQRNPLFASAEAAARGVPLPEVVARARSSRNVLATRSALFAHEDLSGSVAGSAAASAAARAASGDGGGEVAAAATGGEAAPHGAAAAAARIAHALAPFRAMRAVSPRSRRVL
jgi:hypothetical protein